MGTVTINELHERTEELLSGLPAQQSLMIYDDGRPVAVLQSLLPTPRPSDHNAFRHRKLLPGMEELMNRPLGGIPVDQIISEDRDRT